MKTADIVVPVAGVIAAVLVMVNTWWPMGTGWFWLFGCALCYSGGYMFGRQVK